MKTSAWGPECVCPMSSNVKGAQTRASQALWGGLCMFHKGLHLLQGECLELLVVFGGCCSAWDGNQVSLSPLRASHS